MNGEGWVRLARRITRHACRALPEPERRERYLEWSAELPEFMTDRRAGPLPWRAAKMLLCALDQHRGARRLARAAGHRGVARAELAEAAVRTACVLLLIAAMASGGMGTSWYLGVGGGYDAPAVRFPPDPGRAHLFYLAGAAALVAGLVAGLALFWLRRRRAAGTSTQEAAS